jgi:hypothetical protein
MVAKVSRRLVIDASVARSAGGEQSMFPTSKHCRDFLKAALSICHRVVMTPEIAEEWNKHRSNFARTWRVSMVARKKEIRLPSHHNENLRTKIEGAASSEKSCAAMLKDVHLLEAALATDSVVISLDDVVKNLFSTSCQSIGEIKNIIWINPDEDKGQTQVWLEKGAKPDKTLRLGFTDIG